MSDKTDDSGRWPAERAWVRNDLRDIKESLADLEKQVDEGFSDMRERVRDLEKAEARSHVRWGLMIFIGTSVVSVGGALAVSLIAG